MKPCTSCAEPTDRPCGLCTPCIRARTIAECEAQGVPFQPSPETMARLARVLRPRKAA